MPRLARTVFAHLPHHITQRGNRREDVFFDDEDRETYLAWLGEYAAKFKVEVTTVKRSVPFLPAQPGNDNFTFLKAA